MNQRLRRSPPDVVYTPIDVTSLTFALGTAGAVTAFALSGGGGSDNPEVPNGRDTAGEVLHGDPTYEQWLSDFGGEPVATSIDDIDPNVCNAVHNINACTAQELEELGMVPITNSIAVGESDPGTEVEGDPEPLFVDGEHQHEVQSHEEAVVQDCGLAGGAVYVSSDGETGCVIVHNVEDGGEGETQAQPPVVVPQPEVLPAAE